MVQIQTTETQPVFWHCASSSSFLLETLLAGSFILSKWTVPLLGLILSRKPLNFPPTFVKQNLQLRLHSIFFLRCYRLLWRLLSYYLFSCVIFFLCKRSWTFFLFNLLPFFLKRFENCWSFLSWTHSAMYLILHVQCTRIF